MLNRYIAEYEIVTPMFIGGADHEAIRIREASIKGALVFWWRTLKFSEIARRSKLDTNCILREIQTSEQRIFGSQNMQSMFFLNVIPSSKRTETLNTGTILTTNDRAPVGLGVRYLGYGLMESFDRKQIAKAGQLTRSALKQGQDFTVEVIFKPRMDENSKDEVLKALKMLGLIGGLGARMRRGWGSLALRSLVRADSVHGPEWSAPTTVTEYKNALVKLIGTNRAGNGLNYPITAFADETEIRIGTTVSRSSLEALNVLGNGFLEYRGWRNGDQNFKNDHDWFKTGATGKTSPDRTAFGLPHSYQSQDTASATVTNIETDRRASPLLFHVHRLTKTDYINVASFFPTRFTATNKVAISRGKQIETSHIDYDFASQGIPVVQDFLDGKRPGSKVASRAPYFSSESIFE